jgi:RNA polymerase sigma factor (sigma-70 family)
MKTKELAKLTKAAREKGDMPMTWLDKALTDNDHFEKNVKYLIRSLGDLPVVNDDIRDDGDLPSRRNGRSVSYQYLQDVARRPRMNREEELRFSKRLDFFKTRLFETVKKSGLSDAGKELLLRSTACHGKVFHAEAKPFCKEMDFCPDGKEGVVKDSCSSYNDIRGEFIERNLYLVVNVAKQYRTYGIPLMDLVQEGNAALIRAVEKFDWRKDVRFQTYASFWLKQAIERCITANRCIVRLPNYLQQKMRRYKREGMISADNSDISVGEISEAFSLSHKVAGRLLETDRGHVSLDSHSSNSEDGQLTDLLAVEDKEFVPEGERRKLKQRLKKALNTLSREEKLILDHRFGLEGKKVKTLEELGRFLNVSRERIRQLQIKAIEKLKRPSLSQELASFMS